MATSLYLADWATTRDMTKRYDEGFHEKGLFPKMLFGSQPTTKQIDGYFIVAIPTVLFAADRLPQHRKLILTAAIVTEAIVVRNNRKLGLSFQF